MVRRTKTVYQNRGEAIIYHHDSIDHTISNTTSENPMREAHAGNYVMCESRIWFP